MFNRWKSNNKQIKTIFTFLKMQPNAAKKQFHSVTLGFFLSCRHPGGGPMYAVVYPEYSIPSP